MVLSSFCAVALPMVFSSASPLDKDCIVPISIRVLRADGSVEWLTPTYEVVPNAAFDVVLYDGDSIAVRVHPNSYCNGVSLLINELEPFDPSNAGPPLIIVQYVTTHYTFARSGTFYIRSDESWDTNAHLHVTYIHTAVGVATVEQEEPTATYADGELRLSNVSCDAMTITSITGSEVMHRTLRTTTGSVTVPVGELSQGMYVVSFDGSGSSKALRFVVP